MKSIEPTPLMQQYFSIKQKYPHTLLLFRVGDFYETFLEDAIQASKILGIVLTKRSNGAASHIELAGFPHHALEIYLPRLIRAGCRVAICDQLEDAKQAKGIVQRGVTEVITAGLVFSEAILDGNNNNYLASVFFEKNLLGIAFLDLSTGEFTLAEGIPDDMRKLLQHLAPSEVIFNKQQQTLWYDFYKNQNPLPTYALAEWVFHLDYAYNLLNTHFGTTTLKGFGIAHYPVGIIAAGAVLHYLMETEHKDIKHINTLTRLNEQPYLWLDGFTVKALELITPQQSGGKSLLETLDRTITPMGSRLLKKWLLFPLKEVAPIQERLDIVAYLVEEKSISQFLIPRLTQMGDLERMIAKVASARVNPREMVALKKALDQIGPIQELLINATAILLQQLGKSLHRCCELITKIEDTLQPSPPLLIHQGGIIKPQVNPRLDRLNEIIYKGKDYLIQLQQKEIQKTHISSLKVSYNRVFGYYLEVPNTHKNKVPTNWIRKQTLANAERYVTEELKCYEEDITQATEEAQQLEQQLYQELVAYAIEFVSHIQKNAKIIAQIDCYLAFAMQAEEGHYSKPLLDYGGSLVLKDNRHPVIEACLPIDKNYTPNDIYLDQMQQQIIMVTGPNMAGKSALLRQVALTVLMAQMGSFVPASSAQIGIIDKIFTRVGASDNLSQGESTFMVEMAETANIIHNISDRSLILMDEVGRGTSTYDGIAIAWSLVEYIHNHRYYRPKMLFATHYHELNELSNQLPNVKNYHVAVKEVDGHILFLHKFLPGGSEHSFGIHVAKMAGIPHTIVERAIAILHHLSELGKQLSTVPSLLIRQPIDNPSCNLLDAIKERLGQLDVDNLSPIEALLKLQEIKKMVKK